MVFIALCGKQGVTVVQPNDGWSTEQEKKIVRFAERLPPIIGPLIWQRILKAINIGIIIFNYSL
jgi:hypothetical protein